MSRAVRLALKTNILPLLVLAILITGVVGAVISQNASPRPELTIQQSQTVAISYRGEDGKTALELVKKHAKVETKSYSFGELVTAINSNDGGGKKYWLYFVNGKEANV